MGYDTVNYILKSMTGDPVTPSQEELEQVRPGAQFKTPIVANVTGVMVQIGETDPIEADTEKVSVDMQPKEPTEFKVLPESKLFDFEMTASYDESH